MVGMTSVPNVTTTLALNDGNAIPQFGLGVWQLNAADTESSIRAALECGYRHIDTAMIYGNEEAVGKAVADAIAAGDVTREELYITTKLWNDKHNDPETGLDESLQRLGLDYVDLYLMHWPCPAADLYVRAWEGIIAGREAEKTRSIGVCNFYEETLDRIIEATGVTPAVNQVEIHPGWSQNDLRAVNEKRGIVTEAWSPLGQGQNLSDETITVIAEAHGVTPAQAIIRWHIQRGDVVIPRSSKPERVRENADVFGFELSAADMDAITALDVAEGNVGPDPREFNRDAITT